MADVLAPLITDKAFGKDAWDTAIDIAVDCGLEELGDVLATVALHATELEVVRRSAAWALTRIGNGQSRQRLISLVAVPADEDPFEGLKGCALCDNLARQSDHQAGSRTSHGSQMVWLGSVPAVPLRTLRAELEQR